MLLFLAVSVAGYFGYTTHQLIRQRDGSIFEIRRDADILWCAHHDQGDEIVNIRHELIRKKRLSGIGVSTCCIDAHGGVLRRAADMLAHAREIEARGNGLIIDIYVDCAE